MRRLVTKLSDVPEGCDVEVFHGDAWRRARVVGRRAFGRRMKEHEKDVVVSWRDVGPGAAPETLAPNTQARWPEPPKEAA